MSYKTVFQVTMSGLKVKDVIRAGSAPAAGAQGAADGDGAVCQPPPMDL
jgi:hypothetical protein